MGISIRTEILEYYFLYHLFSGKKLTFTDEEIRHGIEERYDWSWDDDFQIGLELLKNERLSRYQPGLSKDPRTETYCWLAGFRESTPLYSSNFFTASHIESLCRVLRDLKKEYGWEVNVEQIHSDAKLAYEGVNGIEFAEGLIREEERKEERIARNKEERDISDIPF